MKDYFFLAYKNVKRRGIRSWLTLLGVVIGIAAVISLVSLGNALKDTVNAQFDISSTEVISVQAGGITGYGPPGTGVSKSLTISDLEAIEKLNTVDLAISRNIKTVKAEFNDKISFLTVGTLPGDNRLKDAYELLDLKPESGRLLETGEKNSIIIGKTLSEGDRNGFDKEIEVGQRINLGGKYFRVVGIIEKKGSFVIDGIIYMNRDSLKEILEIDDDVDVIAVKPKNSEEIDKTTEDIEKLLRDRRDVKKGEEDFSVSTPEAALETVNQILTGIQIFVVIIASVSIFVGAMGIANTMTTSVLERRRDIGIMKAVGARNENIFFQFFVEAGFLGLVGGIIGTAIGVLVGFLGVYGINSFLGTSTQANIDPFLVIFTLLGSFIIGSLSGVIPALNAAKQNPIESMRK